MNIYVFEGGVMPKTIEDIRELLGTELFRKGIAKKFIVINDDVFCRELYSCGMQIEKKINNHYKDIPLGMCLSVEKQTLTHLCISLEMQPKGT